MTVTRRIRSDAMASTAASASSSPTVQEQLDLALQRAAVEEALSAGRTYITACFAIYAWDFILTFPNEYKSLWKADRWTPVRFAFFFNRYWSLLVFVQAMYLGWSEINPKTCAKIHILEPIATTILFLNCNFLLGARVWVVWNRRKWIAWFFATFAICGTALQIWAFAPNKALPFHIWVYWVPLLLYDATATAFMLMTPIIQGPNPTRSRLLSVFLRDGLLYFVIVSLCNLINVIYFFIPGQPNRTLNGPLTVTFTTMMASRIVLHLRTVAPDPNSQDGGGKRSGDGGGCGNAAPNFRTPDMEGWLRVSYPGVMVNVETLENAEKRDEITKDSVQG
ncbi:hypothetical protein BT69DRAFT_1029297 [Atractiella rhizophila]|nr:hypothetical protein BT69DRAFT_1029297 [Atractiella rhizophila]